jgi:predicted phosphate transport protein (TIGR00153 family)
MVRFFHDYFLNGAQFYNLFDQAAKNSVDMADLLVIAVNTSDPADREPLFKQIERLENIGDDLTHKIYLALDKVVFTPLNRGDIHTLASAIDDVADYIHESSERMNLYNINEVIPAIKQIAVIILKASTEIDKAISMLRVQSKGTMILESCRLIKDYERQSDQVYYNALADLFANEHDAITLIKYREILYSLETTTNKCKSVTDVLQAILVNSFKYVK